MGNIEMEIRTSSMSKATAEKTKEFIVEAFKEYKIEKDIAQHVKTAMDELEGGTWHCIVGANFGSSISFSAKHCAFLRISTTKSKKTYIQGETNALIFKSEECNNNILSLSSVSLVY